RNRRSRAFGDCGRGSHEQPGADDRADTQGDQCARAERSLEAPAALTFGGTVGDEPIDGFGPKKSLSHALPPWVVDKPAGDLYAILRARCLVSMRDSRSTKSLRGNRTRR